jgi:hypothetical protein
VASQLPDLIFGGRAERQNEHGKREDPPCASPQGSEQDREGKLRYGDEMQL